METAKYPEISCRPATVRCQTEGAMVANVIRKLPDMTQEMREANRQKAESRLWARRRRLGGGSK